ncbi:hypothetical protein NHQ30_011627 [Ciborinia camelliae]|nr:hypothetical protein NHQ30_011627 [Ciborinia camelliae]
MASPDTPKVALVTGANGITGSAVLKQLSSNPIWTRIIGISRSPPSNLPADPRIEFYSLDLTASVGEIAEALNAQGVTNVTHFFHYAYIHSNSLEQLEKDNVPLFANTLTAIDLTSRDTRERHSFSYDFCCIIFPFPSFPFLSFLLNLRSLEGFSITHPCSPTSLSSNLPFRTTVHRVILQTGGKNYGLIAIPPVSEPLTEDADRVTDPRELPNFYYGQEDFLWALSSERAWDWNITMPFWVSGYVGRAGMSWTTSAGVYFSMMKTLGRTAIFPGGEDDAYGKWGKGQHFSTSGTVAEFTEWVALNEDAGVRNQKFNIVDDTVTTFRDIWEGIGRYFGVETRVERGIDLMGEVRGLEREWSGIVRRFGGREDALRLCTWDTFVYGMCAGEWGSVVSMEKARKAGWTKRVDTLREMERIFGEMKRDGWIPDV